MNNHGNYIVSLGNVCRWLGGVAESLGVEIYPGFAAAEVLYDERGAVKGVATGDIGVAKDGTRKPDYQPGMELHAKYTLFAEGARGSLSQELMARFNLRDGVDPQKYGIGLKELWEVTPAQHQPGLVMHTSGWPLDATTSAAGRSSITMARTWSPSGFVVQLELREPASVAVRRVPALQDAPGDPRDVRRAASASLRRARDQRRRPAVGAEARVPGRRADRLQRRLRQPAAHQGQPQRDEDRHARRRSGVRCAGRRAVARHARLRTPTVGASLGLRGAAGRCATSSPGSNGACGPA